MVRIHWIALLDRIFLIYICLPRINITQTGHFEDIAEYKITFPR